MSGVRQPTEVRDQLVSALRLRRAQETEQAYLKLMSNRTPAAGIDAEVAKLQGPLK